jgi:ABC-type lipoprotein export system ATPase subunit
MNASQDSPFAIEAVLLTKVYGSGNTEVVAMKDASMQVRRGEVVALLGPSGSGKSTFMTAVGLINPPTSGRVIIQDKGATAAADLTPVDPNQLTAKLGAPLTPTAKLVVSATLSDGHELQARFATK